MKVLIRQKILPSLLIIFGALSGVWTKALVEADRSLEQGQQLESSGDIEFSIICYRRTIRWYSPGSEAVTTAVSRLLVLGEESEKKGEVQQALLAYRAVRTGLLGVQSVFQPHSDELAQANNRIAVLMAHQADDGGDDSSLAAPVASEISRHEALLSKTTAPHAGWSIFAVVSFGFWCFSLFSFAHHGFGSGNEKVFNTQSIRWAVVILMTGAFWMTGLSLA